MASRAPLQPTAAKCCSDDFLGLKSYRYCLLKSLYSSKTESDSAKRASRHQLCPQLLSHPFSLMNQRSCELFCTNSDPEKPMGAKGSLLSRESWEAGASWRRTGKPDHEGSVCSWKKMVFRLRRQALGSCWSCLACFLI